ncbi:UDP-N-acetylmuramoyl-tripeptide--D-alanyl-D-alanine ligase, partial [Rhodobacteraceae bacterium WD3A24]
MVAPPLWTAAEAAAATGGTPIGDWAATGVSIDSRTLRPGDLFVALTAARDGHDFVAEALAAGAAAAMVARIPEGVAPDAPLLIVPEVLDSLAALGAAGRARSRATVIGVTGSVGKTSAKEMLRVTLAGQGMVHAAEASHNNHWGVPLTLARLPADADFAVVEMGMNHPGEIAPLARLTRPDVALITAIAPAHLEAMGSLEAIAREKAAILDAVPPGGTAVLPGGHATTPILTGRAAAASLRAVLFAESGPADYRLERITQCGAQMVVEATTPAGAVLFRLDGAGRHFALGALGALAAAEAAGADLARAALALRDWR